MTRLSFLWTHSWSDNGKKETGSELLAAWLANLSMMEFQSVMPLLRPMPKKRGPKGGRRPALAAIENQALANLRALTGTEPTMGAFAAEVGRLRGLNSDQINNIRRDLRRTKVTR